MYQYTGNAQIQFEIDRLTRKNNQLQAEIDDCREKIAEIEEGSENASFLKSKMQTAADECVLTVQTYLDKVNIESNFREYYLEKVKAVAYGREIQGIDEKIQITQRKALTAIDNYEDRISSLTIQIEQNENEIVLLKQKLSENG